MLDPNAQATQTTPAPATAPATEPAGDGNDSQSTQAFLEDILKMRGEAPGLEEGMDETQSAILQNQFKQDTRAMIEDVKEVIREVSPDVGRGDLQKFTKAFVEGDALALWSVAQAAAKKEAEAEQNAKRGEDLRVEGSNSGTKGKDAPAPTSVQEATMRIAEAFNS